MTSTVLPRRTPQGELGPVARVAFGIAGLAGFAVAWELTGRLELLGSSWPPLTAVVAMLTDPDRLPLFRRALAASLRSAAAGYLGGIAVAVMLAVTAGLFPRRAPAVYRMAATLNAVPVIALGPVLITLLPRHLTPIIVATMAVTFTAFVSMASGLQAAREQHHDLLTVLGASRWQRFVRLQSPAALPAVATGLKVAAPAAILGTIIGEWFATERGLGPLLVSAMYNYQIVQLWSVAVIAVIVSLTAFGVLTIVERRVRERFT